MCIRDRGYIHYVGRVVIYMLACLGEMVDTAWPSVVILGVGYTQGIVYEKALRGVDLIARVILGDVLESLPVKGGEQKIHTYGTWGKTIN